jgi:hypothetical protein
MKNKHYYILWVEGLSARGGEKIMSLDDSDHTYTLKMTEALRVKPEDRSHVEDLLKAQGVSSWVFEMNSWIKTSYAPTGTIYTR